MAKTWCVPGSPRTTGDGWHVWYANSGSGDFLPQSVIVARGPGGPTVETEQSFELLNPLPGFPRRVGIAAVKIKTPEPGRTYSVTIPELNRSYLWPTMPTSLPSSGMSFILSSCFWQHDDLEGYLYQAVSAAMKYEQPRPTFKLLVGDQVYLDFPIPNPLTNRPSELVAQYYLRYWGDELYRESLLTSPNFFMCDDHEFWNDYPETQRHLPHTYSPLWRAEYGALADSYYRSFQRRLNPNGANQSWIQFDVPPVSLFVADTRSERSRMDDPAGLRIMSPLQWAALETWQEQLAGPGILVLGQPLFQADGDWRDHSLSNFPNDYARLMSLIERSARGANRQREPHDILLLSGDIHSGRHSRATITGIPDRPVHELIASPASRIGPFLSEPKPEWPPDYIRSHPPGGKPVRWATSLDPAHRFATVENNLAVLRLFPSEKQPYSVRVGFCSYLVRYHRKPSWKVWSKEENVEFGNVGKLRLYEQNLYLS